MYLESERIFLRPLEESDALELLNLRVKNKLFLRAVEPVRALDYYSVDTQRNIIEYERNCMNNNLIYSFGVFGNDSKLLIGKVTLTNIVLGSWKNANLGYFIDQSHSGKGLAGEAVKQVIDFAFTTCNLHRLQAAIMPSNEASKTLITKNKFRYEGLALKYLEINGVWEDHMIYALTYEEWELVKRGGKC